MGEKAYRVVGLGHLEAELGQARPQKLVACGAYANGLHFSNFGNNECFEPYTSNIYSRRVLAGEFQIVNSHMLKDLVDLGIWNDSMKNNIIANNGSIQSLPNIPDEIKALYKTVWEISQKHIIDMAADRAAFIDQSQSLNIHIKDPTMGKLTSMHFYGWKKGLKTGMYYLRTQAAAAAIQFTVDQNSVDAAGKTVASLEKLNQRKYVIKLLAEAGLPRLLLENCLAASLPSPPRWKTPFKT